MKERGDVTERLELLPLLKETANRAIVISEMAEAMRDAGLLEEALALLETSFFQNWEGGETAGLLWSSAVGALAERRVREGHPATRANPETMRWVRLCQSELRA